MTGHATRLFALLAILTLGACASPPKNTGNSCAIFEQRSGLFTDWRGDAERVSAEFGVPVSVLMATIQAESNFKPNARPPRTWFLFIPTGRISSAYGYAQALDGTWDEYRRRTGRSFARRDNFADAIHFIGWYHADTSRRLGISRSDAARLYLAYHSGHAGYEREVWRKRPEALRGARRAATMAARYEAQLRRC
ncbi:transglycosylase SLT domain-containing protein [Aureimonas psammosilenae]|uniref:transglycosylase SLT domain-containing protein n=1 Tax=Aureimonas psammosilenae TaxID=2495496 RepID=UPI001260DEA9|nr:transglycosylase SLT domain-containing protein [Aureimonas psammosilenae]